MHLYNFATPMVTLNTYKNNFNNSNRDNLNLNYIHTTIVHRI